MHRKSAKGKSTRMVDPKLYLPDGVEFSNPTPRTVVKEGDRKWPENAKWICVYCRLILKNLHNYKAHLRVAHRIGKICKDLLFLSTLVA